MNTRQKQRFTSIAVVLLTFGYFMVFLTKMHPIALFDTDSWRYAYYHRHPWPLWGDWNPTRVFPEVVMPLVSQFSACVIYPIVHDYFFSLTIGYAIAVSATIALLTWMVFQHFRKEDSNSFESIALTSLFLICHFLFLRSAKQDNKYMLLTDNTCTYFYYVIPNLLNCVLVFWLMDDPKLFNFFSPGYYLRKSLFVLFVYFCVFSNLWGSMISGIYAGVVLLVSLIKTNKKNKHWIIDFLKKNDVLLLLLALWFLAQLFEFNGGRADNVITKNNLSTFHDYWKAILQTLTTAGTVLPTISGTFLWMAAILCVGGIAVTIWKKQWHEMTLALYALIIALLTAVYLILSCAVSEPPYIARPDTFYGFFFYIVLILLVAFRQIMRHLNRIRIIVPLCLAILACECNTSSVTFQNSMYFNLPAEVCYRVDNDILQQLQRAVEAGKKSTVLYIPQFDIVDNYPLATYGKSFFPTHLYKQGVLSRNIKVKKIVPTKDKNKELQVKY